MIIEGNESAPIKFVAQFKIGQFDWSLYLVGSDESKLMVDDQLCFGACNFAHLQICLSNQELAEQVRKATLVHELTHAFLYSFGMQNDTYNEEQFCDFMESHAKTIIEMSESLYKLVVKAKKELDKELRQR